MLKRVRECLEKGNLRYFPHAEQRLDERRLDKADVRYVLQHGRHEKRKDEYKAEYGTWNYAIRGKTIDGKDVRVAVTFIDPYLMIVSVIKVGSR